MKRPRPKILILTFLMAREIEALSPITTTEGNERKFEIKLEFENDSNDIINIQ